MMEPAFNQIELGLFSSRVAAICEEMGVLLGRSAFSPNIRDRKDYSCALFDASGALLGQATHIPVHLGSMAFAMSRLASDLDWGEGDVLIVNDPFQGGTHLPDITLIEAVHTGGQLVGFSANRAHHADIGADAPGSMPVSTRLEQEGVLIPPTFLVRSGDLDQEVFSGLLDSLRDGKAAEGDFKAQLAACRLGSKRLRDLSAAMGISTYEQGVAELQSYAHRLTSISLANIPDGDYEFVDYLDDDGAGQLDVQISVRVTVDQGQLLIDFSGTAGQVRGNLNCPLAVTFAAAFYVVRCLLPTQVPACEGAMRCVTVTAPEGSLVNARAPAAVAAGNVETSMRIVDAVSGALAQAVPGRIPAASQGTMNNVAMGRHGSDGWDYYETIAGGMGGGIDAPGHSARHSHMTNTLNTPVEIIERHYPLEVLRYQLRHQSGGKGEHTGGDGVIREYRFLEDAELALLTERRLRQPWGMAGGAPGKTGLNALDGKRIPAKIQTTVRKGQVLTIKTPGGGGYGKA